MLIQFDSIEEMLDFAAKLGVEPSGCTPNEIAEAAEAVVKEDKPKGRSVKKSKSQADCMTLLNKLEDVEISEDEENKIVELLGEGLNKLKAAERNELYAYCEKVLEANG